jgi:hypothetical protein
MILTIDFFLFEKTKQTKTKTTTKKQHKTPLIERADTNTLHTHTSSKKDSVSKKPLARKSNNERLSGKRPGIFRERKR